MNQSNVVPMFRECPITGLREPNVNKPVEPVYYIYDQLGRVYAIALTLNEAINRVSIDPRADGYRREI